MATRIKLKRSTVAATVPTTSNLEDGEVALNIADKKLYARNGSNIIEVANQKPNTGEVVTTMLSTDITNGQGNTYYVATNDLSTSVSTADFTYLLYPYAQFIAQRDVKLQSWSFKGGFSSSSDYEFEVWDTSFVAGNTSADSATKVGDTQSVTAMWQDYIH